QIDRALAWSDSQHGVRPASHRGLTLNSAQKGAKASRLNCRSAAVPHESDGARELRMALSGCVNRSSEPAASRKRSFRLPQTHRAKRRGQPANPERRRYLRADSFSGSQFIRDELVWDKAIFLQQLAHKFKRRPLVLPALDQHIEHFALGVDGAPKIDHAAADFQIDFVQMPSRRGLESAFTQVRRDLGSKMVHPAPVQRGRKPEWP